MWGVGRGGPGIEIDTFKPSSSYRGGGSGGGYSGYGEYGGCALVEALRKEDSYYSGPSAAQIEANSLNKKGIEYSDKGDWDNAIEYFKEAVAYTPNNSVIQDNLRKAKGAKANDKGIEYFEKGDWNNAIKHYEEALGYDPDNSIIKGNLEWAEREAESEKKQQAEAEGRRQKMKEAVAKTSRMLDDLAAELAHSTRSSSLTFQGPPLLFDKGTKDSAPVDLRFMGLDEPMEVYPERAKEVLKEQEEFEKMNAKWLENQQKLIQEAVESNRKWYKELMASVKDRSVPLPPLPETLSDLQPGDKLLIAPEKGEPISNIIAVGDPLVTGIPPYTGDPVRDSITAANTAEYLGTATLINPNKLMEVTEKLVTGRPFEEESEKRPAVSHELIFLKSVNGKLLFLDHTSEGSRILDEKEYLRKYGHRDAYVARPLTHVDGEKLWEAAKREALEGKSDFGLFGGNMVCSEKMAFVLSQASDLPKQSRFGPIDETPGDPLDKKTLGKYHVVSPVEQRVAGATPQLSPQSAPAEEKKGLQFFTNIK